MTQSYSIYIHIPFCQHRCSYCDFNTYAGIESLIPDYIRALCREIRFISLAAEDRLPVHTVFFGGGTPSLLPLTALEEIFYSLKQSFLLHSEAEVTLEANPGTLTLSYLQGLHSIGINRLSLGMQSANSGDLRLLERQHDLSGVVQSVRWARQAGYKNLNLDLIFGIPYQSLESWNRTLRMALSLLPEHLSLYALTLEHGTPLEHWVSRGLVLTPDDDLAADMYDFAAETLEKAGYIQYEISNWARRDSQGKVLSCLHNLQYWRSLPYLGLGAGAHGYAHRTRTANVLSPPAYIHRLQAEQAASDMPFPSTPAAVEVVLIDRQRAIGEYMMMGLRLVHEGVSEVDFRERFGKSLDFEFKSVIKSLEKKGLLEWNHEKQILRLTPRGRLLGNQVFCEFI